MTVKGPVCGMDIDLKSAAGKSEYEGQTYYFCSNGCKKAFDKEPEKYVTPDEQIQTFTAFLAVWGMGCAGCAVRVHNSLISLNGVVSAQVNHVNGIAMVDFNPHLITTDALIAAVASAGNDGRHKYQAKLIVERTL